MTTTMVRNAEVIAAEIQTIKNNAQTVILQSSIEIGRRLVEAKELVSHGQWTQWLQENVEYSQSTAHNLMQIYREYGDNSQALGNLSYTKAVALLGMPAEERETFVQDHDVEAMSSRELQKAIKEKTELERQLKEAEQQVTEQEQRTAKVTEAMNALQAKTVDLERQLQDANQDRHPEETERLQFELDQAHEEIRNLQESMSHEAVDVPAVVEKIPAEVEQELADLRKKVVQPSSAATIQFKVYFDHLVRDFQALLDALQRVADEDPENHSKYQEATSQLLSRMTGQV